MTKHILFPLALTIIFITFLGFVFKNYQSEIALNNHESGERKKITLGEKEINVEIADNEAKRKKGLSGRNSIEEDSGMLFIFEEKDIMPSFWMKDMKFPLDIIWINDEKIAQIKSKVPVPKEGTADANLPLYTPDKPIDYVLEVNAGFCEKNNIKVGDSVNLDGIF